MNGTWQTASYSMTGDTCVEARTAWATSSYSAGGATCVETRAAWRKSSYSCGENNCVEVANGQQVVQVRDTKDRDRGIITFGSEAWKAFIRL